MKKIPLTVHIDLPENLDEAIKIYGSESVFKDYLAMLSISMIQKMRQACKITIVH